MNNKKAFLEKVAQFRASLKGKVKTKKKNGKLIVTKGGKVIGAQG